jgi:hypothetical protein
MAKRLNALINAMAKHKSDISASLKCALGEL